MTNATRENLAQVALQQAQLPLHGCINGEKGNIDPLVALFPKWNLQDADKLWCAAFVYYCCVKCGFVLPYSPDECQSCSLAGCGGWEEFALGDSRVSYIKPTADFVPQPGDIVLFDRVFENKAHDHIGIVVEASKECFLSAEGNVLNKNVSAIVTRQYDEHVRAYIRLPENFVY